MTVGRRLLHGAGYWAWRAASGLAQRVPAGLTYALAAVGGELAYFLWAPKREIAKRNLATVLGLSPDHPAVARAARGSFRNFARYLVEIMRFPALTAHDIDRLVSIEPATWQHLRDARVGGRGLIFVSIHFGNFELGGARIAAELPITVIADDIGNARLMDLLAGNRAHKNITLHTPDGAAKKVLRALRRNELVGLMMDLGPRALSFSNVEVDFFGKRTSFPAVAAELARASGAPIVVAVTLREHGNTFRGVALPPVVVTRTQDAAQDVERATQAIARGLETFVRRAPDQWYIFRPMWPASATAR